MVTVFWYGVDGHNIMCRYLPTLFSVTFLVQIILNVVHAKFQSFGFILNCSLGVNCFSFLCELKIKWTGKH